MLQSDQVQQLRRLRTSEFLSTYMREYGHWGTRSPLTSTCHEKSVDESRSVLLC